MLIANFQPFNANIFAGIGINFNHKILLSIEFFRFSSKAASVYIDCPTCDQKEFYKKLYYNGIQFSGSIMFN